MIIWKNKYCVNTNLDAENAIKEKINTSNKRVNKTIKRKFQVINLYKKCNFKGIINNCNNNISKHLYNKIT